MSAYCPEKLDVENAAEICTESVSSIIPVHNFDKCRYIFIISSMNHGDSLFYKNVKKIFKTCHFKINCDVMTNDFPSLRRETSVENEIKLVESA